MKANIYKVTETHPQLTKEEREKRIKERDRLLSLILAKK
jgi:hypothetical protein